MRPQNVTPHAGNIRSYRPGLFARATNRAKRGGGSVFARDIMTISNIVWTQRSCRNTDPTPTDG
ncbi:hypothetical protein [Sphingobium sp.]|uniref:hypothetical protein n=1 Tax=Sphingobium sp. TaxID=1912891 RepID=UPI00257F0F11|nr:hypothetical protein [Sphingobium sp.]MBR2270417.1 hypothetical protein [Sphingobium sp.]